MEDNSENKIETKDKVIYFLKDNKKKFLIILLLLIVSAFSIVGFQTYKLKQNSKIVELSLIDNAILRINLNNPKNLNALSENMIDLLQNNLDKAASDKNIKVIIISGEGSAFSSGHDLKELKAATKAHGRQARIIQSHIEKFHKKKK